MVAENHYQMRFAGGDITPEKVPAKELAEIITSFEDLIVSSAISEHPQLAKEDLALSLVGIKTGSINLEYYVHTPEVIAPTIKRVTGAIRNNDFSEFTPKSLEAIKRITAFTHKHKCQAEIIEGLDGLPPLATITSDTKITPIAHICGITTVYGMVFSIGGIDPNVHIELPDGSRLICRITKPQAKSLAGRLYNWVGFQGKAKWDTKHYEIQEFQVEEILDYQPGDTLKTLEELTEIMGEDYRDITDVSKYIEDLRYRETEDG